MIYRAYRVPYEWTPQLEQPQETPNARMDIKTFRAPGASPAGGAPEVEVEGMVPFQPSSALCVVSGQDQD